MKKLLTKIVIAVVLLLVVAVVFVRFFLDSTVKAGVERVGPMLTKVSMQLDSVHISLFSGAGRVNGLTVSNPEGFKTANSIKVGSARLQLQPGSILSEKVIIRSIDVQGPEITYETDLKSSNLRALPWRN